MHIFEHDFFIGTEGGRWYLELPEDKHANFFFYTYKWKPSPS